MYCRPGKDGQFRPLGTADAAALVAYNVRDVLLLEAVFPHVSGHAEPEVVALDRTINERGVAFDADLARQLLALEQAEAAEITGEMERATGGKITAADLKRVEYLRTWLRGKGRDLPDLLQATVESALADGTGMDPAVRLVLQARLATARVAGGKLEAGLAYVDPDGRLRHSLVFHKAHTGRWAGRGLQPHNLPRPPAALKDLQPLIESAGDLQRFRELLPAGVSLADGVSALIRPCFRAAPGYQLAVLDFASVEARGVAWCADERGLLELFASGGDPYCTLAAQIFGRPVRKEMKRERAVGKEAVLGCGYGMGGRRFAEQCTGRGIDLTAAGVTPKEVVESYRNAYPAICGARVNSDGRVWRQGGLWRDMEAAACDALRNGRQTVVGHCRVYAEEGSLIIKLPSGRRMTYRNARIEDRMPGYATADGQPAKAKPTVVFDGPEKKHRDTATYGGKLTENVVQALCRDLLVAALLEFERRGFRTVLHVHDEAVVEVPEEGSEQALRRLAEIMSSPPAWALGFPVEIEGFLTPRYMKDPPPGAPRVRARNGQVLEGA